MKHLPCFNRGTWIVGVFENRIQRRMFRPKRVK